MTRREGHVWYGTTTVGSLRADDRGRLHLTYDRAWIERGFPISVSLPLERGVAEMDAHPYFEGLLPEGRARRRIARRLAIDEEDDAALLFAIGRDCAGALTILPDDEEPAPASGERVPLSHDDLLAIVQSGGAAMPDSGSSLRFSLAGAQDKLAVILEGDAMWLPSAFDPSSHILKFETLPWVCFAEHMGSELARRVGMETCETVYVTADTHPPMPYLRLRRYDRRGVGPRRERVHQEDVAQALGYPSEQKYEQDGGPSLGRICDLLRDHVRDPIVDITRLRDWQIFNYLIGNSDGHAKNLALVYDSDDGVPRLAPFYDLVGVEFHNRIGAARYDRALALHVGERSLPEEIRRSDWEALARSMHVSPAGLSKRLAEWSEALPEHAAEARVRFAEEHGDNPVYDRFVETISDRCRWVRNNVLP